MSKLIVPNYIKVMYVLLFISLITGIYMDNDFFKLVAVIGFMIGSFSAWIIENIIEAIGND